MYELVLERINRTKFESKLKTTFDLIEILSDERTILISHADKRLGGVAQLLNA